MVKNNTVSKSVCENGLMADDNNQQLVNFIECQQKDRTSLQRKNNSFYLVGYNDKNNTKCFKFLYYVPGLKVFDHQTCENYLSYYYVVCRKVEKSYVVFYVIVPMNLIATLTIIFFAWKYRKDLQVNLQATFCSTC